VNLLKNKRPAREAGSRVKFGVSATQPEHLVNILSCSSGVISTPSSGFWGGSVGRSVFRDPGIHAGPAFWALFFGSREWSFGHAANFFHVRGLLASSIYRFLGFLLTHYTEM